MNEFEKWWILEGQNIIGHYDLQEEALTKVTWKAALKWVLSLDPRQEKRNIKLPKNSGVHNDTIYDVRGLHSILQMWVEEELESLNQ